jgi:cobalamin biosynthesis protein CobD/CbiB
MLFRYYTNAISQATRGVAMWILIVGLLLVGFGVLILALPELFALLAALVFFVAGASCLVTALKIYLAHRKIQKLNRNDTESYRKNVRIRTEEYHDL